jgi:hypothetical protein
LDVGVRLLDLFSEAVMNTRHISLFLVAVKELNLTLDAVMKKEILRQYLFFYKMEIVSGLYESVHNHWLLHN